MRSTLAGLLLIMATMTGCATVRNTPAQDLAWERWTACDHFTAVTLDRVDLDGRIVVNSYENTVGPFTACVERVAADQSRTAAVPLPQSLVLAKIYGCQGGAM
jgi:hypothetical protein